MGVWDVVVQSVSGISNTQIWKFNRARHRDVIRDFPHCCYTLKTDKRENAICGTRKKLLFCSLQRALLSHGMDIPCIPTH